MEAVGIIAEYNPFHKGHLYHLQQAKSLTGLPVIAVISGHIMQRGDLSLWDKWTRATMAVACGVDLVLELPAAFSLRSAQYFATGGVRLLEACGCVSHLVCGVENAQRDFLAQAHCLKENQQDLQGFLKAGHSYGKACSLVLEKHFAAGLDSPNDILALEYTKACLAGKGRPLIPHYLQRQASDYRDSAITGTIASATAIRAALNRGEAWQHTVPEKLVPLIEEAIKKAPPAQGEDRLWQLLRYQLLMLKTEEIAARCQASEGLEHVLKDNGLAKDFPAFLAACQKKRYPLSRLRRLCLQLLLQRPREYFDQKEPAYLRVLAFNDRGRQLLHQMKTTASLPLLTKLGKNPAQGREAAFGQQLDLDIAATGLASLLYGQVPPDADYLKGPVYVK